MRILWFILPALLSASLPADRFFLIQGEWAGFISAGTELLVSEAVPRSVENLLAEKEQLMFQLVSVAGASSNPRQLAAQRFQDRFNELRASTPEIAVATAQVRSRVSNRNIVYYSGDGRTSYITRGTHETLRTVVGSVSSDLVNDVRISVSNLEISSINSRVGHLQSIHQSGSSRIIVEGPPRGSLATKGSSRNFVESWDWQGEVRRVMCRDDAKSGRPLRVITWFDVALAGNVG
jgi:hypothetical protein